MIIKGFGAAQRQDLQEGSYPFRYLKDTETTTKSGTPQGEITFECTHPDFAGAQIKQWIQCTEECEWIWQKLHSVLCPEIPYPEKDQQFDTSNYCQKELLLTLNLEEYNGQKRLKVDPRLYAAI